jgi:hypothetical protein
MLPPHFMDSEISLGLNKCRITFGTALECIEPAGLLLTARKPYLHKYQQKLYTALAKNAVGFLFSCQNNPPGGTVKTKKVKNICCLL